MTLKEKLTETPPKASWSWYSGGDMIVNWPKDQSRGYGHYYYSILFYRVASLIVEGQKVHFREAVHDKYMKANVRA